MKTIHCPVCKAELEGEFQLNDVLECPQCSSSFSPLKGVQIDANFEKGVQTNSLQKTSGSHPLFVNKDELQPESVKTVVRILWFEFAVLGCLVVYDSIKNRNFPYFLQFCFYSIIWIYFISKLNQGRKWARRLFLVISVINVIVGGIVTGSTILDSLGLGLIMGFAFMGFPILRLILLTRKSAKWWTSLPEQIPLEDYKKNISK